MVTIIGMIPQRRSTMHATIATLRQMLASALLFHNPPLFFKATMDSIRAGMERMRLMTDAPHVIRVQRENMKAKIAILLWFFSDGDRLVVVDVIVCVITPTEVLANCSWKWYI